MRLKLYTTTALVGTLAGFAMGGMALNTLMQITPLHSQQLTNPVSVLYSSAATAAGIPIAVSTANALPVNIVAGSGSGCVGTSGTPCVVSQATAANLNMTEANSASILTAIAAPVNGLSGSAQSSSNPMGYVNINQTTPGTTNAVDGTGAAGTASTHVMTVQGIVSMTPILDTPQASENHIGEVGGNIIPVTNAMTTSNHSETTGLAIGGLQTLAGMTRVSGSLGASGTSGIIQSAMVTFSDAVTGTSLDVYYFNANPSSSTCTDNTSFALNAADRDKVIGVAHVTDFTASNGSVIAQANNLAMPYGLSSATSAYACVVSRSTLTITSTANASLITRTLRQ